MENLITWLEKQIEGCDDLGGMEKEKWAFIQTLKKVRKEQLTIPVVVGQSEQFFAFTDWYFKKDKEIAEALRTEFEYWLKNKGK